MTDDLIAKYGRRLYGLCRTLTSSPQDADDLYQETWLKVCAKFQQYSPEQEFEGWLTAICVNTYRDSFRRRLRSPFWDFFPTMESKDLAFAQVAASEEPRPQPEIQEAVDKLPEKLRMTVILYYFQELDQVQTAKVLKIPVGTVKSRLSKAKKLLKEMMQDEVEL